MERLTKRYGHGMIGIGDPLRYYNYDDIKHILEHLATIEDILGDDYDLDRLRELVKADQEGRCVVLPCKVGDKIYTTHRCKDGRNFITEATVVGMHIKDESCRGYIPRKEYVVCRCNGYSKHIPMDHIGKRAFFSFKAAEAALKGEQA